jgi:hypothetical protein
LCREVYKCEPDDPRITEMEPVRRLWMYQNWVADQEDLAELAKNHAYVIGSFTNPEAVQQLTKEANVYESSEDDLDETTRMVRQMNLDLLKKKDQPSTTNPRRRRHHLKD